jgi:hypothetical protein
MHPEAVHNEPIKLSSHHNRRLTNRRQPLARALHDLRIGPRRRHDLDCGDEVRRIDRMRDEAARFAGKLVAYARRQNT